MKRIVQPNYLGLLIAILFIFGTLAFGYALNNYSLVSQTLSEIGSIGSPLKIPFQIFKILIAFLILLFASSVMRYGKINGLSVIPGLLLLSYGLTDLGLALFPTPHPLHNYFGLSMTLGYLAPLFFSLLWPKEVCKNMKITSAIFFLIILLGIFLNLSPAFIPDLYPLAYYGIVQRFLVFTMYIYLAYLGICIWEAPAKRS